MIDSRDDIYMSKVIKGKKSVHNLVKPSSIGVMYFIVDPRCHGHGTILDPQSFICYFDISLYIGRVQEHDSNSKQSTGGDDFLSDDLLLELDESHDLTLFVSILLFF
jgi:hypothetical protein